MKMCLLEATGDFDDELDLEIQYLSNVSGFLPLFPTLEQYILGTLLKKYILSDF